jgi:hypothetical protein
MNKSAFPSILILIISLFPLFSNSQELYKEWEVNFNTVTGSPDIAIKAIPDQLGNIYALGRASRNENNGMLIMKFSAAGDVLWDLFIASGVPKDIAIDGNGNVYAAGALSDRYAVFKINSNGVEQWRSIVDDYRGDASSITSDYAGNVLVLGRVLIGSLYQMRTIKFSPMGDKLWENSYSKNLHVEGVSIDVNETGDVFVAGTVGNTSGVVIAFDPSGNVSWTNSSEYIKPVKLKAVGEKLISLGLFTSSLTSSSIRELNQSTGAGIWSHSYNGPVGNKTNYNPADMAIDLQNNIFITGVVAGNNFFTLKYSEQGILQWEVAYDDAGKTDEGKLITVDDLGNCYVSGRTRTGSNWKNATLKYDTNGNQQWVISSDGDLAASDSPVVSVYIDKEGNLITFGNLYIGSSRNQDFSLIKYTSQGNLISERYYNSRRHGNDQILASAMDMEGNLILMGREAIMDSTHVVKYSPEGVKLWDSPVFKFTSDATQLDIDTLGNIYLGGRVGLNNQHQTFCVVKLDKNGQILWVDTINADPTKNHYLGTIKADPGGNLYFSLNRYGINNFDAFMVIKYNTNGSRVFGNFYTGNGIYMKDLAIGPSGNIYITGNRYVNYDRKYDITVFKIDPSGTLLWTQDVNENGNEDTGHKIAFDDQENVYVIGNLSIYRKGVLVKFSEDGTYLWRNQYPATPTEFNDIKISENGEIYVCGSTSNGWEFFALTLKYSPEGDLLWSSVYDGPTSQDDFGLKLALDPEENVYTLIREREEGASGGPNYNITLAKYNKSGLFLAKTTYDGPGKLNQFNKDDDRPESVFTDASGGIYVTASTLRDTTFYDFTLLKYNQCTSFVDYISAETTICHQDSTQLNVTPGHSYQWTPTTGLSSALIADPKASPNSTTTYSVKVTDSRGCSEIKTVKVNVSNILINHTVQNVSCNGGNDGKITASASNGIEPYHYNWTSGIDPDNLSAGSYTLSVTDLVGCQATKTIAVSEPPDISLSLSFEAASPGESNGQASVSVTGGTPPYSYSWNDPDAQTSFTATGLTPGVYKVIVTDKNNCTKTDSVEVLGTVGIPELSNKLNFDIYPNPAVNEIHINLPVEIISAFLSVTNISGQKVLETNIFRGKELVSLENIPAGIYFFKLNTENKLSLSGKFAIVK